MTKRKRSKNNDQPNLKRLRVELTEVAAAGLSKKEKRYLTHGKRKRSKSSVQSRKEKRKEERRLKKLRNLAYHQKKPIPTMKDLDLEKKKTLAAQKEEAKQQRQKAIKEKKKKRLEMQKQRREEERQRDHEMANMYDDKMIREMEKNLKLDKRKKDTFPKAFIDDGLDYILDVVGGSSKLEDIAANRDSEDSESEADRLAMYGMMGDQSDEEDTMFGEMGEQSDEEPDRSDEEDENIATSDDDESDDGNNEIVDRAVPQTKKLAKEDIKSILKKNKESKHEKTVKWETDKTAESPISLKDRKGNVHADNDMTKKQKSGKISEIASYENSSSNDDLSDSDEEKFEVTKKQKGVKNSEGGYQEKSSSIDALRDIDEDLLTVTKKRKGVTFSEKLQDKSSANDELSDSDDEIKFSEEEGDEDDDEIVMDEESDDNIAGDIEEVDDLSVGNKQDSSNLKEDIYGRLRDEEGNIVKPANTGAYVPPARRLMVAQGDEKKKVQLERLKKQLKGLVNRTSETNIQPISSQIENFYLTNSRADVNESLISLIFDSCVTSVLTPERLAMELMMLIAILHGNVGSEVGAVFLQHLVRKFDELGHLKDYGIGKEIDNVIVLLCHLYNFKVVHSVLIFDIVHKLVSSFMGKDVELILLILKNVGFTLRKDDPSGLKSIIQEIQSKASSQEAAALTDQSRVRFMLDVIMAVRNNNMRKIPNYDPEHLEHLKKLIRNYIRGGQFGDNQLHISLEDLLKADELGKWWVVGSAWSGQGPKQPLESLQSDSTGISGIEVSSKLQQLARKQRMNTDLRRNIFYIIMTSEDYIDAFEKLLRLGIKSSQQQEIVLVILDCCLQEKKYNPFYSYLGQKFCEHHRSFQMAFQFTIWDKFKELGKLSEPNRNNLGKFLTHLFATKALSLSIFKVVTFGTLEKPMVRLLKQVLTALLLEYPHTITTSVFQRIAQLDKLKLLHEGLRLFLHHFILGKRKDGVDTNIAILKERVEMIDKIFSSGKSQMLL